MLHPVTVTFIAPITPSPFPPTVVLFLLIVQSEMSSEQCSWAQLYVSLVPTIFGYCVWQFCVNCHCKWIEMNINVRGKWWVGAWIDQFCACTAFYAHIFSASNAILWFCARRLAAQNKTLHSTQKILEVELCECAMLSTCIAGCRDLLALCMPAPGKTRSVEEEEEEGASMRWSTLSLDTPTTANPTPMEKDVNGG